MSNTLDADFYVEAFEEAIQKDGLPEIFNTDQGRPFARGEFIKTLTEAKIRISMDGRGGCMDNIFIEQLYIFIEQLWRSLKHETIYRHEMADGFKASKVIDDWMVFYNIIRSHSSLDRKTAHEACWQSRKTFYDRGIFPCYKTEEMAA